MSQIERLGVSVYTVPTDKPESDGTLAWDSTTIVVVEVHAGGRSGLGYSYTDRSAGTLINRVLSPHIIGKNAFSIPQMWVEMVQAVRNLTRPGIASMAIAAVDAALWDLKARLLEVPLASLLGQARTTVPIYGSGGFTSYSIDQLQTQLRGWIDTGLTMVKMKVGREPARDFERVSAARTAIGDEPALFVDANGAYLPKQALAIASAAGQSCGPFASRRRYARYGRHCSHE